MKLYHRLIALLLVLMLLVCAGCSARDDAVYVTTTTQVTAATTSTVKQTTPLITLPHTTTTQATTTQVTTTQTTVNISEPDTVKTARALLTEVYESRVFDDSLDLTQNPGLLSQRDFTGPFLCGHLGDNALRYCPKVYQIEDLDPALPEDVKFLEARQDELPEALLELLLTPEKDELLAEGKGMFAVLEYIGYGDAGDYTAFKLYYHRTRISFYDFETGEMLGWIDTTESHQGPMILKAGEYGYDGNHSVLLYNGELYNEPPLWEKALNELFYDENGYLVVGTRLVSVPEDADPIVVPEGVTRIDEDVGRRHKAVELILPESLESIGESAFLDSALVKVSIPKSVRFVDIFAFGNTPWINEMKQEDYVIVGDGVLLYAGAEGDEITLPEEVRYVRPWSLKYLTCRKLTVPNTVVQLCGQYGVYSSLDDLDTLETLVLRGGLQEVVDAPGVILNAAYGCKSLTTLVIDCDTGELPDDWITIYEYNIDQLTVYCKEGSPAEAWAKEQGIRCLPLSEYDGD